MIPQRVLGLGEQLAFLRMWWPGFRSLVCDGALSSTGKLQPSELSESYTVNISQHGGRSPEVRVISPTLRPSRNGENIPHMYMQERLCLFLPGSDDWKPHDPIAHTIIPWTSMWLYFYELWHATGEWLGGGIHPEIPITLKKAGYEHRHQRR